ncbi:hypothetical protein [Thermus sp.]|uniref:hypothetical protein n=1 Tax=Thermus sp. TaxID=275 RepID=UPI003D0C28A1
MEIAGYLNLRPRGPKVPLAVRLHQGYWVEVVRLEGAYFALVDLEKQALTKATLAELGNEALQHLRALQETPPLKALDPTKRRDVPLEKASPEAHLLLHPRVLSEIEAPLAQGSGLRRLSQDTFWESQFRFEDLDGKVRLVFQGILDPEPWTLPPERLATVAQGALRMGQGLGREPKEVLQKGFFRPLGKAVFHLAFPQMDLSISAKSPAGQTQAHIKVKPRGKPEEWKARPAYAEDRLRISARELLLLHFVDKDQLKRSSKGQRLLALTPSSPSFLETWEKMGASLELQRPPLVYDPKTGEALQGGPLAADIAFLLAPEEVAPEVLKRVHKALETSARIVQWVQPTTLQNRPHLRELAYNLARKAGAIPFLLEGFTRHVLGLVHTRNGFFWRLLSPEGQLADQGSDLPQKALPQPLVVHFRGGDEALERVLSWTGLPLVRIQTSRLRFSKKALPLGTYFRPIPELAYLHAHPGHPGWPKALKVEVVQGDLPLEEAVAQVYWLTKVEGGLHHPNVLPLSVAEPTGAPGDPD